MGDRDIRGGRAAVPEPLPFERRESARAPLRVMVRDLALGGSFEEHAGNVSLGGVYFAAAHPPPGAQVELRFLLPGESREVHALGEVIGVSRGAMRVFGSHVRFVHLDLESELAIARWLERVAP